MNKDKFYCTKCYYLTSELTVPEKCPICNSESSIFEEIPENSPQFIPDYWEETVSKKIEEIKKKQKGIFPTFALVTDMHWASNTKHSLAIIERVIKEAGVDMFFNGGDIVCGSGVCPKESLFRELDEYSESFEKISDKCLMVLGNHDQAYSTFPIPEYYIESITTEETFKHYFEKSTKNKNIVFSPTKNYCYLDSPTHKMRYIALNTHVKPTEELDERGVGVFWAFREAGIMQEQFDWLINEALNVPDSSWTVAVSVHEPEFDNMDILLGIFDAFRKHTTFEKKVTREDKPYFSVDVSADFSGKGGDFAIIVCGHLHSDEDEKKNGILITTTANDSLHNSENFKFKHIKGTVTEQVIDFFTIDKENHKILVTRIGAGENREFEYEVF